jgi:uncharacterized membrane protein
VRTAAAVLGTILVVAYPIAVLWALSELSARSTGLLLLAFLLPIAALRVWAAPDRRRVLDALRVLLPVALLAALGALLDDERLVLAMPVLINGVLLVQFAASLLRGPTVIERFARLKAGELDEAQVAHCRQVTVAWCIFFVLNGGVSAALAFLGLRTLWAIYTGGVAYALMGLMFSVEYVVRRIRFRHRHRA